MKEESGAAKKSGKLVGVFALCREEDAKILLGVVCVLGPAYLKLRFQYAMNKRKMARSQPQPDSSGPPSHE